MKTRLLLLLSTICLSAEEPRPVYPESTESKVRETLSRVAVPKGEFKDSPLADAVRLLRMKLAAAGDDVRDFHEQNMAGDRRFRETSARG